jgi:hypothetical protein
MNMRVYLHQESQQDASAVETAETTVIADALGIDSNGDVVVLVEDADEPLNIARTFAEGGLSDRTHLFCGRHHRIEVAVSFNGEQRERAFSASTRVERVFRWAVGEHGFELGKADAAEHTLALSGTNVIPPSDAHLGSLPEQTPCHVAFMLIPKHRYEG